jgi:hypothetical protein
MKQSKSFIPPNVPKPASVIAYAMESGSQLPGAHAVISEITPITEAPACNMHAINVLTKLEKAIETLPVLPNACRSDEIAVFSKNIPTDLAKEDAWKYLDPMLNCFLGFNRMAEGIYNEL